MAAKNVSYGNAVLQLVFNGSVQGGTDFSKLLANAPTPLTELYLSLNTGTLSGNALQDTHEAKYPGYARVATTRSPENWTVSGENVFLAKEVSFPLCVEKAYETEKYFTVGTQATGPGQVLYYGTLYPNLIVVSGVIPQLTPASEISEL